MKHLPANLIFIFVVLNPVFAMDGAGSEISTARMALQKANAELQIALQAAEKSLGPHTPGSGWTKNHMQIVLNVVEGKEGPDFSDEAQTPGNGQGVLRHLEEAQAALKGASSPSAAGLLEAIHYTRADLNEAIVQAKASLKGNSMTEIHARAGLAAGLLVAARGVPDTSSPVTGALTYALRALSENPGAGGPNQ